MSTPAKSQNVCRACRSRKKKCDGSRPSCTTCVKRGEFCLYGKPTNRGSRSMTRFNFTPEIGVNDELTQGWDWPLIGTNDLLDMDVQQVFTQVADVLPFEGSTEWTSPGKGKLLNHSENESSIGTLGLPTPQDSASPPPPTSLPPLPQLLELVELFFDKFYHYFPIIHKSNFLSKLKSTGVEEVSHLLLYSMIAVSSGAHYDYETRQSQLPWFEEAKTRVSKDMRSSNHTIENMQAAVFIIYQSIAFADFSVSLLVLGEAWRKAVAIGYVSSRGFRYLNIPALGIQASENWIDREESVRVSWMLFMMDRVLCFPIGLTHAIDDRKLRLDFPIVEEAFQGVDEPEVAHSVPFMYNFDSLLTAVQDQCRQGSFKPFQFLILSYALLGQISDITEFPESDGKERSRQIDALSSHLVRLRLMLPRSVTELSAAKLEDFPYVLWLNAVLSTCTILLHHRPLGDGESFDDATTEMATNWPYCVAAARSTVAAMRDSSRANLDFVNNAHLPGLLFTSCKVLIIEYFCPSVARKQDSVVVSSHSPSQTRDPQLRAELEVMAMAFNRTKEALHGLGKKFSKGMNFYLRQDEEFTRKSKQGGARFLLGACDNWTNVSDEQDIVVPA